MAGPIQLFDRSLLDARRRRALARPPADADFLLRSAVDDLLDRLSVVKRDFPLAVDLGTPLPALAERLSALPQIGRIARIDRLTETLAGQEAAIAADPELLPLRDASVDLVVSALAFQWLSDVPGALAQIHRALKPDGLMMVNLLGGETLHELRQCLTTAEAELTGGASPRVAPFAELRDLGGLLQRTGFALPVIDQDRLIVRYANAFELMRDLRAMGAANALVERSRRPASRQLFLRTASIYAERYSDPDGRIRATFDIISLSGWSPHESQQKPLKPGSARTRLADALGVTEELAGDKASHTKSEG